MTDQMNEPSGESLKSATIISDKVVSLLRENFPRETHETKKMDDGFLQTGVKPAYVIERLNKVLGMDGWDYEIIPNVNGSLYEIANENEVVVVMKLNIYVITEFNGNIQKIKVAERVQVGGNKWDKRRGLLSDAIKGAITNAICKCASLFDVAHEAYKGLLPPIEKKAEKITEEDIKEAKNEKKEAVEEASSKLEIPSKNEDVEVFDRKKMSRALQDEAIKRKLNRNHMEAIIIREFGKSSSRELTDKEMAQLLDIVKRVDEPSS